MKQKVHFLENHHILKLPYKKSTLGKLLFTNKTISKIQFEVSHINYKFAARNPSLSGRLFS